MTIVLTHLVVIKEISLTVIVQPTMTDGMYVTNLAIVIMTNGIVMILANVTMEHICLIVKDQIIMVMFHITRPADVAKLSEREL